MYILHRGSPAPLLHHFCGQHKRMRAVEGQDYPYRPIENVVIAILQHRHRNVRRIARGNTWLGHQERGSYPTVHQRFKPFLLLRLSTVSGKDFHVSSIWRCTVCSLSKLFSIASATILGSPTSDAVLDIPKYSAIRPYSRFVKPAPSLK